MKYVLDTATVLALLKGKAVVIARMDIAGKDAVSVPQPVWAQLAYALERLPESNRKKTLQERCTLIRDELARAPWTDFVSEKFGAVKAELERLGTPMGDHDVAMAAHAVAAGAVLVTTDVVRMRGVPGLEVEDWASET
jgi:tRNA(fMet)-specific endonuclease VapC